MAKKLVLWMVALAFVGCPSLCAQQTETAPASSASAKQTETDEYTRYELLAPETASFRIHYEVTATTGGSKFFYNPIRKGSAASDESVYDSMTGEPLHFQVVSGPDARKDPLMADADADTNFIKISLARPVPPDGQGRILILKTYKDAKSYYRDGDAIVFNRPLGIRRNKIVLPAGYELVGCNVPSQILAEPDGRIADTTPARAERECRRNRAVDNLDRQHNLDAWNQSPASGGPIGRASVFERTADWVHVARRSAVGGRRLRPRRGHRQRPPHHRCVDRH